MTSLTWCEQHELERWRQHYFTAAFAAQVDDAFMADNFQLPLWLATKWRTANETLTPREQRHILQGCRNWRPRILTENWQPYITTTSRKAA
ncbi:MAG: hypothetical protein K9N47_21105 [Prosthecobacter sp.]|uniref:hypothetical protein n=1 Tax=Prosthecobacter sp. TaxID=1965333 RepID=UPI0026354820|nr:hypothetical protein [Prosthecobacter sp.]MCF7788635.1 hypothetical protein [Prosthecobacter sp.]